ncbi:spondin domain-containing protein [Gilvimarinus sp. 1_MG-2023]|uniref:spondin domain-containing protein n=1 Tax=Gilvimarinus sp. 1_MG-2023 TaxID=3062638 RepID=UPI0026E34F3E|nr:spondin domain-containing protein [Gilvimarinus sp. 1_MG-2023]MDO6748459.1 spondin domain-containing protein [Gilvimarinus sp. 1_MG-2023]
MKVLTSIITGALLSASGAQAAEYTIDIQNLTRGSVFAPLVVAAHSGSDSLFMVGESASTAVQAMAEGGDISGLVTSLESVGATISNNPAEGLLMAGDSVEVVLNTDSTANTYLSLAGMIVPSNDGFVGLNSLMLPTETGVYHYTLNAYDAGTEANDELRGSGAPGEPGLPVPPPLEEMVGHNATGVEANAEGFVHIHRGVLGDTNAEGGSSDLDAGVHRWLNPVAHLTITVQ